MLPIIVFERESESIRAVREAIDQVPDGLRILSVTSSAREATRFLAQENGITLVICGLGATKIGTDALREDDGVQLAHMAQNNNRDSYVVLTASSLSDIEEAMNGGIRVSGVIIKPVRVERAKELITRVMADFEAGISDQAQLSFKLGNSIVRITRESLLYAEASGKKLDLWTKRQRYSVYGTLNELEAALGDGFFRCHRSYLANIAAIERADYSSLEVCLTGGVRLPLARSQKSALREKLKLGGDGRGA